MVAGAGGIEAEDIGAGAEAGGGVREGGEMLVEEGGDSFLIEVSAEGEAGNKGDMGIWIGHKGIFLRKLGMLTKCKQCVYIFLIFIR